MSKYSVLRIFTLFALICVLAVQTFAEANDLSGKASWMGQRYQGQLTSSGDVFDMNDLTASHVSLPYGQKVKVTSLKTGKTVEVTINDRLEPSTGRVIDLSKHAAEKIGLVNEGIGQVDLELLQAKTVATANTATEEFNVRYGVFANRNNADNLQKQLQEKGISTTVSTVTKDGQTHYHVASEKAYSTQDQAKCHITLFSPEEGMVQAVNNQATAPSTATIASTASQATAEQYQIQYGSFTKATNADILEQSLNKKHINVSVSKIGDMYKVLSTERYESRSNAKVYLTQNPSLNGIVIPATTSVTLATPNVEPQQPIAEEPANTEIADNTTESDTATGELEYGLQYGAFSQQTNANALVSQLSDKGVPSFVYQFPDDEKGLYRVLSQNPFPTKEAANTHLTDKGIDKKQATILTFYK